MATEQHDFVICINNTGFPASLEVRKVYRRLSDAAAASHRMVRVIDESGEDYLFPEDRFVAVELSDPAAEAVALAVAA